MFLFGRRGEVPVDVGIVLAGFLEYLLHAGEALALLIGELAVVGAVLLLNADLLELKAGIARVVSPPTLQLQSGNEHAGQDIIGLRAEQQLAARVEVNRLGGIENRLFIGIGRYNLCLQPLCFRIVGLYLTEFEHHIVDRIVVGVLV